MKIYVGSTPDTAREENLFYYSTKPIEGCEFYDLCDTQSDKVIVSMTDDSISVDDYNKVVNEIKNEYLEQEGKDEILIDTDLWYKEYESDEVPDTFEDLLQDFHDDIDNARLHGDSDDGMCVFSVKSGTVFFGTLQPKAQKATRTAKPGSKSYKTNLLKKVYRIWWNSDSEDVDDECAEIVEEAVGHENIKFPSANDDGTIKVEFRYPDLKADTILPKLPKDFFEYKSFSDKIYDPSNYAPLDYEFEPDVMSNGGTVIKATLDFNEIDDKQISKVPEAFIYVYDKLKSIIKTGAGISESMNIRSALKLLRESGIKVRSSLD